MEAYVDIIRDAFKMRLGVMVCRNFEKIDWHKPTAYDSDLNTVYLSTQIKSPIGSDDENETAGENGSPDKQKLQENEKNQTKSDTSDSPNGKENFHKNCKKMPKVFV